MSMNSVVITAAAADVDHASKEAIEANRSAELLAAASEGRGDEVMRILEADPELIRVGDTVGDTALHVFVRANYMEALCQLFTWFLQGKHDELLKEVAEQGNGHGDTPLHLAVKNMDKKVAFLLYKVAPMAGFMYNDDGKSPHDLAIEATRDYKWFTEDKDSNLLELKLVLEMVDQLHKDKMLKRNKVGASSSADDEDMPELVRSYDQLLKSMHQENSPFRPSALLVDIGIQIEADRILKILEADVNLIHHKERNDGNTVLHELASSGNMDMIYKLISLLTTNTDNDHMLRLLVHSNKFGDIPLHLAVGRRHTTVARYLMELAPESAYRVNNQGVSPLYLALDKGLDDLVKYVLEVMPEASISPGVRKTLLTLSKASLPHSAIRRRDLTMLKTILESIPSLIDSSDAKGWKPLSYAAYKGYLEEVGYLLNQCPESAEKFDSDGSFPIHKAVSGGHISIIQEFISIHPQTLYLVDKKGRTVLHIAVRYAKADVLSFLTHDCSDIQKIFHFKDSDGMTFVDSAKLLKRN